MMFLLPVMFLLQVLYQSARWPEEEEGRSSSPQTNAQSALHSTLAPPLDEYWDHPMDFGSDLLLSDFIASKLRVASVNSARWQQHLRDRSARELDARTPEMEVEMLGAEAVSETVAGDLESASLAALVDDLEELYTLSCDPHVHERLARQEEGFLWGH